MVSDNISFSPQTYAQRIPVQSQEHHIPHRHFQGIYAARVWLITSLDTQFRNVTSPITLHVHTACTPVYHIVGHAG